MTDNAPRNLKCEFGHSEFGHDLHVTNPADLGSIRKNPAINLVTYTPPLSPKVIDYLDWLNLSVDFSDVEFYFYGTEISNIKMVGNYNHRRGIIPPIHEFVKSSMSAFPNKDGILEYAQSVILQAELFCIAAEAESVMSSLMIKIPQKDAIWHADAQTDLRALVTWKGQGTYWLPNNELNGIDANRSTDSSRNFYGMAGIDFTDAARQVPPKTLTIMKGHMHNSALHKEAHPDGSPLFHTEPVTRQTLEPRLIQLMNI